MPLPNYSMITGIFRFRRTRPQSRGYHPIIPGIKPIQEAVTAQHDTQNIQSGLTRKTDKGSLEMQNDAEAQQVGIEWCIQQCRELMEHRIPSIHFYSIGAVDSIREVAKQIY